jgi:hypothetical protein
MRAAKQGLSAVLAILAVVPAANDNAGHPAWACLALDCETCWNRMSPEGSADPLAPLAKDPEGESFLIERAAADVAARLGVELEPDGGR